MSGLEESTLVDEARDERVMRRQRALNLISQAAEQLGQPVIYLLSTDGELIIGQRGEDAQLDTLIDTLREALCSSSI